MGCGSGFERYIKEGYRLGLYLPFSMGITDAGLIEVFLRRLMVRHAKQEWNIFCSLLFTVQLILLPSMVSYTWDFSSNSWKWVGWGIGFVYIFSLFTFDSSIVLPVTTFYLFINTCFPHRNNIRNASKGGNPNRKLPYHPYGFRNLHVCKTTINGENSSLFMNSFL